MIGIVIAVIVIGAVLYYSMPSPTQSPPATTPLPTPPSTADKTIVIQGSAFNPSTLTIKAGTKVIWLSNDTLPHTIVSDTGNELNSPELVKGLSYSHTFSKAGTYAYHCSIHRSMKGTIVVE